MNSKCTVTFVLLLFAWPGDLLVEKLVRHLPPKSLIRCTDTALHGLIAAASWLLVTMLCPEMMFPIIRLADDFSEGNGDFSYNMAANIGVAFSLATVVDVDHVIADLISFIQGKGRRDWTRGWFHYSLPPLVIAFAFIIIAIYMRQVDYLRVVALIVICVIGHHIRDGMHHGLWLQPLGVTQLIPHWLYLALTMTLPFNVAVIAMLVLTKVKKLPQYESVTFEV